MARARDPDTALTVVGGQLATEEGVSGVILVAGLILVSGMSVVHAMTAFVSVVSTMLVFWSAHVFAAAVAHRTARPGSAIRTSLGVGLRHSWGLLVAPLAPAVFLLLGATEAMPDSIALWAALWSCVVILGALGYLGFRRRGSSTVVCLLGALATAGFGLVMVGLKVLLH